MNSRTNRRHAHARVAASRAFTLIELLLVLVILAVLAAVVVPKFTNRSEQAKRTAAATDIANIETALDAYEIDNGSYPEELGVLAQKSQSGHGPYLKQVNDDPWGRPYVYVNPGQHSSVDLYSVGPDGREGTDDDVTNWKK